MITIIVIIMTTMIYRPNFESSSAQAVLIFNINLQHTTIYK